MVDPSDNEDVQRAVANLLQRPAEPLMLAVRRLFADRPTEDQGRIFWAVKGIVAKTLPTAMDKGSADDVAPVLLDRLKFAWTVVNAAESRIKSIPAAGLPTIVDLDFVRAQFDRVIEVATLTDSLLNQMCDSLYIGPGARFLKAYHQLLKATKATTPKRLSLSLLDQQGKTNSDNLRRAIFWLIRKRKDQYVDTSQKPFDLHFAFLAKELLDALELWFDSKVRQIPNIKEEIENSINAWLEYNCLGGDDAPDNQDIKRDIAVAFVKHQKLTDRIVVPQLERDPAVQRQLRELEQENSAYADENRKLEEELRRARAQLTEPRTSPVAPNIPVNALPDSIAEQNLQEILKLIDSKYSFDMLHDIQLGEPPTVTMNNFIAHLLYVLRKKGLCTYQDSDAFDLNYDQSGLYNCLGFQVGPGTTIRVTVVTKGWGIKSRNRLIPIRYAQVRSSDDTT